MPASHTAPLTELEAVNFMLGTISESPINTLEGSLGVDAVTAINILRNTSRQWQTKGWHFNTDVNVKVSPDSDGYLTLPSNAVEVDTVGTSFYKDLVQHGTRLYDPHEQTYEFTEAVYVNMVKLLDFDILPEAVRWYITVSAARKFADQRLGEDVTHVFTKEDEIAAQAQARKSDTRNKDRTIFDHPTVARAVHRRRYIGR